MRLQRRNESMMTLDGIKVGDVELWMENGSFRLEAAGGPGCDLSAEDAQEVLDLLSGYREEMDQSTVAQENDDLEVDYTGGWLCVGC